MECKRIQCEKIKTEIKVVEIAFYLRMLGTFILAGGYYARKETRCVEHQGPSKYREGYIEAALHRLQDLPVNRNLVSR